MAVDINVQISTRRKVYLRYNKVLNIYVVDFRLEENACTVSMLTTSLLKTGRVAWKRQKEMR